MKNQIALNPNKLVQHLQKTSKDPALLQQVINSLRKAGVPEHAPTQ